MTIREATLADADCLVAMATRFLESTPYGRVFPPAAERLHALVATCLTLGVIFVAEVRDAEVVGMIAVAALEHPFTGDLYADEIAWWVELEHRGGAIGPRLLGAVSSWAQVRGLRFVKLAALAGSDVGAFYERMGYEAVETAYMKTL